MDMETVFGFFSDVWEKKACVLASAGWLDAEGTILVEAIEQVNPE